MKIKDQNGSLVDTMNKKTRLNVTYWDMLRLTPHEIQPIRKKSGVFYGESLINPTSR